MSESSRKVIVLGSLLSPIQELGSRGIECIVMNHHRAIPTYSRYGTFVKCPNPSFEEDNAIGFVYDYCRKDGGRPILMPVTDQWTMALSRHADRLREVAEPCVANRAAVELMLNKELFCRWGREKGIRTPRVWELYEVWQLPDDAFPVLVKPRMHRWSSNSDPHNIHQKMVDRRLIQIKDRGELKRFVDREEYLEYLFFQEYVQGGSEQIYTLWLYADRSSAIIASVAGHKVRGCLTNHGDCNLGERIETPPDLLVEAAHLVAELHYTGVLELEYKQDLSTGEIKLIEVNPRLSGWVGMSPACGINLPFIAYQDMAGTLDTSSIVPFSGKVRYARVISDFFNCHVYSKLEPTGPTRTGRDWLDDLKADRLQCYDLNKNDLLVTVLVVEEAVRTLAVKITHRVGTIFRGLARRDGGNRPYPSDRGPVGP
jgi:D-aspartate ligase